MKRVQWIGIFGGSFNPPHLGHLLAAVYALKVHELDEIWFVPAWRHAFSKDLEPFGDRVAMCKRLLRDLGPRFKVSTIERDLRSDGRMLNTLLALRKKHRNCIFSLVIGSDILAQKKKWYRFGEIERRFLVLVVPRAPFKKDGIAIPDISGTAIRNRLLHNKPLGALVTPDIEAYLRRRRSFRLTLPHDHKRA